VKKTRRWISPAQSLTKENLDKIDDDQAMKNPLAEFKRLKAIHDADGLIVVKEV